MEQYYTNKDGCYQTLYNSTQVVPRLVTQTLCGYNNSRWDVIRPYTTLHKGGQYCFSEEQDLLDILDIELLGIKAIVSILIEPS